ncbi:hypothetical protein AVJ28_gp52 [Mycobacterium phage Baee]|uniref:DNA-binding phage zinc finger domain-containing protein n=1 Tax=Mycobacterium phage Baee TaxID=1647306 RepID=A0A0F6WEB3_9CAUD|nr:hypothetical protein AVJ28_gp52 [Mycobacterium phage Baee]AKF14621.1 hypothetical protein SEA_BAEE_52 [Mycobacterium phage Baee]
MSVTEVQIKSTLAIECTRCGAVVGEVCRRKNTRRGFILHFDRLADAKVPGYEHGWPKTRDWAFISTDYEDYRRKIAREAGVEVPEPQPDRRFGKRQAAICTGPECTRETVAHDLCGTHRRQQKRGRELTPIRSYR